MRKMHMVGFALIAALAFSVIGATSAFATSPEWLVNGAAVTASVKVDSEGTVVLTDLNAKVKLECTGTDKGTIGGSAPASKTAEETTVTATACKTLEGTCPSPSAKAAVLPWKLELTGTAPTRLKFLTESGYEVVCAGIVKDTCKAAIGVPALELLLPIEDPLHFEFPVGENENSATCSLNNKKEGDVAGLIFVLAEEEAKLLEVS